MKRKGTIWIVIGLLLIAAALCLAIWDFAENARAGRTADTIMDSLYPEVVGQSDGTQHLPGADPSKTGETVPEMPVKVIDGNEYVAILDIPALELQLPVFSSWDYTKLYSAPCRFYGSAYTNDLVICAHNYSRHFGSIKNLSQGDDVTVIDTDGNVFNYKVVEIETLYPSAVDAMTQGDGWDLTLFTCTLGGRTRVTVRCRLVE